MNRAKVLSSEDESKIYNAILQSDDAKIADEDYSAWLSENSGRLEKDAFVRNIWDDPEFTKALTMVEQESLTTTTKEPGRFNYSRPFYLAMAASLAIFVLAVAFDPFSSRLNNPEEQLYQTALQEVHQTPLADGSIAELSAKTTLGVRYTEAQRHIQLFAGEAQFSVTKDASRPFIVETEQARMEALGTVFNVDQRGDVTELSVLEGRVSISPMQSLGERKVLSAGERLIVSSNTLYEVKTFDVAQYKNWLSGWASVDNMPLSELLIKLNRFSQVKLSAKDISTENLLVSGNFDLVNVEKNIQILETLHNLNIQRKGSEIIFQTRS